LPEWLVIGLPAFQPTINCREELTAGHRSVEAKGARPLRTRSGAPLVRSHIRGGWVPTAVRGLARVADLRRHRLPEVCRFPRVRRCQSLRPGRHAPREATGMRGLWSLREVVVDARARPQTLAVGVRGLRRRRPRGPPGSRSRHVGTGAGRFDAVRHDPSSQLSGSAEFATVRGSARRPNERWRFVLRSRRRRGVPRDSGSPPRCG